jgi:hypothetical protein
MRDDDLFQGFEALQPETSINLAKSEGTGGPNQQIRLSDEILTFIENNDIEAELKDEVCSNLSYHHYPIINMF